MYKTIEAIYDKGQIIPFSKDIIPEGMRVLIIFDTNENSSNEGELNSLKNYKNDEMKDINEKALKFIDNNSFNGSYSHPELLDEISERLKNTLPDGLEYEREIRKGWEERLNNLKLIFK